MSALLALSLGLAGTGCTPDAGSSVAVGSVAARPGPVTSDSSGTSGAGVPGTLPPAPSALPTGCDAMPIWDEGTSRHGLRVVFNGFGAVSGDADCLRLEPEAADEPGTTHAALVVSERSYAGLRLRATLTTEAQLRRGSAPNAWEVGWLVWHYRDAGHFYAFVMKPHGWELSKQDPAYRGGQRFLASGTRPRFALGTPHSVEVTQVGNRVVVRADGHRVVAFVDRERPYTGGAVGAYSEDARVLVQNFAVTEIG